MDRAWPHPGELRRALATDREAALAEVRALVDASAGSLARMARLSGTPSRIVVWRLLLAAGLHGYQREVQERVEREYGYRGHRRGITRETWAAAHEAGLAAKRAIMEE